MRRILELIFRHWLKLITLLTIPVVIAVGIVWFQPRQYEATATLWALQRYAVIGASGAEANLFATPASTQATALTELLQTRSFDLSIAKQTKLASTFDSATRADPNKLGDAIVQELSTKVVPSAIGFDLYSITYASKDPDVAHQVVNAVVDQFGAAATSFSVAEANQLLKTYQDELTQAQKSASDATQAATGYALAHPNSTAQNDAVYSMLAQNEQGAQATVANIDGQITKLNQQLATIGSASNSLYKVVDAPRVNSRAISRTKTLALGGGVGLAVGLLAMTILLVLLSRRDRSVYSQSELSQIVAAPVVLELPHLTTSIARAAEGRGALPKPARPNK